MREGDIVLTPMPQSDGGVKLRPAVLLRQMPRFGDYLVCGISSRLHQHTEGFDEVISPADDDFNRSGLMAQSLIRLGYLALLPSNSIPGAIGAISPKRHTRLLGTLSNYLVAGAGDEATTGAA